MRFSEKRKFKRKSLTLVLERVRVQLATPWKKWFCWFSKLLGSCKRPFREVPGSVSWFCCTEKRRLDRSLGVARRSPLAVMRYSRKGVDANPWVMALLVRDPPVVAPCSRLRSMAKKKNALSLMIGPPMDPPNCSRSKGAFTAPPNGPLACRLSERKKINAPP